MHTVGEPDLQVRLTLQCGRGQHRAQLPAPVTHCFGMAAHLRDHLSQADLVVCHAGAGTLLEGLEDPHHPPLLVVINDSLMGNHQQEVAHALHRQGRVHCCAVHSLLQGVQQVLQQGGKDVPQLEAPQEREKGEAATGVVKMLVTDLWGTEEG